MTGPNVSSKHTARPTILLDRLGYSHLQVCWIESSVYELVQLDIGSGRRMVSLFLLLLCRLPTKVREDTEDKPVEKISHIRKNPFNPSSANES